jgi:hypothetical protein
MPQIPNDEWIRRFAKAFRDQVPEVSGDEAMRLALAEGDVSGGR